MEQLGLRQLLIVGDSISMLHANSLFHLIEGPKFDGGTLGLIATKFVRTAMYGPPGGIRRTINCPREPIRFRVVRNDQLSTGANRTCVTCWPWIPDVVPGASTTDETTTASVSPDNADVPTRSGRGNLLLLNLGANHYSQLAKYDEYLQRAVTVLRSLRGNHRIIFRTSYGGHAGCTSAATGPIYGSVPSPAHVNSRLHNWHLSPQLNSLVERAVHGERARRALMQPAERARTPQWGLLDVYQMTMLRPDGHLNPPEDCLHYSLPGVVDWWSHALFSSLSRAGKSSKSEMRSRSIEGVEPPPKLLLLQLGGNSHRNTSSQVNALMRRLSVAATSDAWPPAFTEKQTGGTRDSANRANDNRADVNCDDASGTSSAQQSRRGQPRLENEGRAFATFIASRATRVEAVHRNFSRSFGAWAASLHETNPSVPRVVLMDGPPDPLVARIASCLHVRIITVPILLNAKMGANPSWRACLAKLHLWNPSVMAPATRVAFLDPDTIALGDLSELFRFPHRNLSFRAVPESGEACSQRIYEACLRRWAARAEPNIGVMAVRPSMDTFERMRADALHGSWFSDQIFWGHFLWPVFAKEEIAKLPPAYNFFAYPEVRNKSAFNLSGVRVLHFAGAAKPWAFVDDDAFAQSAPQSATAWRWALAAFWRRCPEVAKDLSEA